MDGPGPGNGPDPVWLQARLIVLAASLNRLKNATKGTPAERYAKEAASDVWWILASMEPTAGYWANHWGFGPQEALQAATDGTRRLRLVTGGEGPNADELY
jgi:hypothetical protein